MTSNKENRFELLNEDPERLADVLKTPGGLKVSIVLPIETEPPESDQNPSRLKDLSGRASDLLADNGLKTEGVKELMRPVEDLLADPASLLRPADALALLVDEKSALLVEIPYRLEPQVTVGNRFLLKPLLPLLQHDSNFTVATLSRGEVKVYQGSRLGICEVDVPKMPTSIEDVTRFDDPEKSIQHHTSRKGSAEGRPGSTPVAAIHGQGLPSDLEKSQNERFFREVAHALEKYLANDRAPLVIFGVDENLGFFHSFGEWDKNPTFSVHHDPTDWSKSEVLGQAAEALEPYWEKGIAGKVDRLNEALQKDSGIFETAECVLAAATGRVEMVCVASDREEPGVCEPEKMQVKFVDAEEAGCAHDLLDTIAYETLKHGGEAFVLPSEKIPGPGNTAATVRF